VCLVNYRFLCHVDLGVSGLVSVCLSDFPSIDNTNTRERLISKVRNVIKDSYGPRYGVRPYGSSVYMVGHGLSTTNNGDLDLVVLVSHQRRPLRLC
jgi:hypothetical protein